VPVTVPSLGSKKRTSARTIRPAKEGRIFQSSCLRETSEAGSSRGRRVPESFQEAGLCMTLMNSDNAAVFLLIQYFEITRVHKKRKGKDHWVNGGGGPGRGGTKRPFEFLRRMTSAARKEGNV